MSALPPADHRKLVGILGRLGSDAEGERAAAGLLATQMLSRHGLAWSDIIARPTAPADNPKAWRRAMYPDRAQPPEPVRPMRDHQREAFVLLVSGYPWGAWERSFLSDIRQRPAPISNKQQDKLRELRRKAERTRESEAA